MRYDETRYKPTNGITFYRIKNNMSQRQLADQSGVSYGNIGAYETNRRDIHKAAYTTIKKLADAMHCTVDDILNWSADKEV